MKPGASETMVAVPLTVTNTMKALEKTTGIAQSVVCAVESGNRTYRTKGVPLSYFDLGTST